MARISIKHGNIEVEVEAEDITDAEKTFAKIADGVATGTSIYGGKQGIYLFKDVSAALKKK